MEPAWSAPIANVAAQGVGLATDERVAVIVIELGLPLGFVEDSIGQRIVEDVGHDANEWWVDGRNPQHLVRLCGQNDNIPLRINRPEKLPHRDMASHASPCDWWSAFQLLN